MGLLLFFFSFVQELILRRNKMSVMIKKVIAITLFSLFVFAAVIFAQSKDVDFLKQLNNITDTHQKIDSLKEFLKEFPESQYAIRVRYELFSSYLEIDQTDSALNYADQFLKQIPSMGRYNGYNDIAYTLALKKVGLDSAKVYAERAVETARTWKMKNIGMFLDTQALVMFDLGKTDSALVLEKEAIIGHEDDPTYLNSLATYEGASGKISDAIKTAAKAIILGNTDESLTNFNKWVKKEKPGKEGEKKLKEEIAKNTLKEYFSYSKNEDKLKSHSVAAAFLANIGVNLPEAYKWAKEAVASKNLSLEDKVLYTRNYAIVLNAEGKSEEALKKLESVKNLADPWDSDFWYTLGKLYEKVGNNKKALDAYISGSIAYQIPKVMKALMDLGNKEGLSEKEITEAISKKQTELADFKPGHYKEEKSSKGKTVLAELFTGAECPPCAGADFAFDALSDYYPRNVFTILEYHVHIPAPDPMTNPDSFKRYLYYGGNFGTPTVIIEGKEKITGGGPKYLAANRFNVYKYAAEKYLNQKPEVQISGSASNKNDKININLKIKGNSKLNKSESLHVALVEKTLNYPGGNGVTKNIFVVRHLINGSDGVPLKLRNGSEIVADTLNLTEIENELTKYLNDPTKYPSWRRSTPFTGWKERTDKLNKNNLAVVAWVQDNNSKEVMQSYYLDVPKAN